MWKQSQTWRLKSGERTWKPSSCVPIKFNLHGLKYIFWPHTLTYMLAFSVCLIQNLRTKQVELLQPPSLSSKLWLKQRRSALSQRVAPGWSDTTPPGTPSSGRTAFAKESSTTSFTSSSRDFATSATERQVRWPNLANGGTYRSSHMFTFVVLKDKYTCYPDKDANWQLHSSTGTVHSMHLERDDSPHEMRCAVFFCLSACEFEHVEGKNFAFAKNVCLNIWTKCDSFFFDMYLPQCNWCKTCFYTTIKADLALWLLVTWCHCQAYHSSLFCIERKARFSQIKGTCFELMNCKTASFCTSVFEGHWYACLWNSILSWPGIGLHELRVWISDVRLQSQGDMFLYPLSCSGWWCISLLKLQRIHYPHLHNTTRANYTQ